jgi:hypothetical protein
MAIKAALKIVLHAGDTIVADSDDAALWSRVLAAIHDELRVSTAPHPAPPDDSAGDRPREDAVVNGPAAAPEDAVARFAGELGLGRDDVQRACAPSKEPPYIHLDRAAWQAMKDITPPRGPGSLARAAVAATLLVLWFRCAELGSPTVKMVHKVLRTIDMRDKNAARVIREARWLQARGGAIVLNAANAARALALAKAFCARNWTAYRTG